jgi:thioredoxin-dependent peroxiredoxin
MTFLVDPEGRIQRVWPKVKVDGHVQDVLATIRGEEDPKPKAQPVKKLAKKVISRVGAVAKKVKAKARKKPSASRRR